ncbi:dihydrodipicolinate synthase family protein [bacterium]|nr:dihydrodipicolinate synthase family protein [bacterium]
MKKIIGPVYPICPAFKRNEELDVKATANYIKYLKKRGARNFIITAGTSRVNLLNDDELKNLNSLLCENTSINDTRIVSNHVYGGINKTLEFVEHAAKIKATSIIIYYSERFYGLNQTFEFFKEINKKCKNIKFMLHAVKLRNEVVGLGNQVDLGTKFFDRMITLKNFNGIKEEFDNSRLRYKLISKYSDKFNIITAGPSMQGFLNSKWHGLTSYLSSVGSFDPKIEENFFYNISKSNNKKNIIKFLDLYENFWEDELPEGWHVCMKAGLSLMGIMNKTERLPLRPASEQTIKIIKKRLIKMKIL